MGLYDTIIFRCPDCDKIIHGQSKSGDCTLESYPSDSVPIDIAYGVIDDNVYCEGCKAGFKVKAKSKIKLKLKRY